MQVFGGRKHLSLLADDVVICFSAEEIPLKLIRKFSQVAIVNASTTKEAVLSLCISNSQLEIEMKKKSFTVDKNLRDLKINLTGKVEGLVKSKA